MSLNITQLHQALNVFDTPGFQALLQAIPGPPPRRWDDFAGPGTTLPDAITNVIAKAEAQGWTVALLKAVSESQWKNNPKIVAFFADHPEFDPAKAPAAPPNPFVATILLANRPFVGRDRLRKQLPLVGKDLHSRILMVDGACGSGKSYTNDFLQFMALHHIGRVHYLDLDKETLTLERFALRLQEELKLPSPIPPKDSEQDPRWAERLAGWVLKNSVDSVGQTNVWLVLDGFAEKEHDRGVHELIEKLGEMIDSTAASQAGHFRLVLLNYGSHAPEAVVAGAFEEAIEPPKISDFQESFVLFYEAHGMTRGQAETAFQQVQAQALAKSAADPKGPCSLLKWLNLGVTKAVKVLNQ